MGDQLAQDLLTDHDRGNRIAGQADDRRAVKNRQNCGLARHDINTVDQDVAQRFQGPQRKIVLTRGGAGNDDDNIVPLDRLGQRPGNGFEIIHDPG